MAGGRAGGPRRTSLLTPRNTTPGPPAARKLQQKRAQLLREAEEAEEAEASGLALDLDGEEQEEPAPWAGPATG